MNNRQKREKLFYRKKKNYKKAGICIGMAAILASTVFSWDSLHDANRTSTGQTDTTIHTYDMGELASKEQQDHTVQINGKDYTVAGLSDTTEQTDEAMEICDQDIQDESAENRDPVEYIAGVPVKEAKDASDVVELINDNWDQDYTVPDTETTEPGSDGSTDSNDKYQLKRLMVLTDGAQLTDSYGASEILHYGDYNEYVLQFDTTADTEYAYYELADAYGTDHCFIDQVVDSDILADVPDIEDHNSLSWGGSVMGFGYLKAEYDYYVIDQEVTVAIIDTGLDATNKIFKGRIDTKHSYCFQGKDKVSKNKAYTDGNGHGTHVAGIIADNTPENVKLMILKTFDDAGKSSNLAIRSALQYAVSQKADVVNMSLGWTGLFWKYSTLLKDVLKKAEASGTVVCCAAGNYATDVSTTYPANRGNVITVTAMNSNENFAASYSNYGDTVDFCAPGTSVVSTYLKGKYQKMSGTSMATPHITAAVAYVKMIQPSLNYKGVKKVLKKYAVDKGTYGWDPQYGWGYVNLHDYFDQSGLKVQYTDYDENGNEKPESQTAFSKQTVTREYGSKAYRYKVTTNSEGKVTYQSSNTRIAEADEKGYISIKGVGSCTITATVGADAAYKTTLASYTLTVTPKDISGLTATLSKKVYQYAGKSCKPSVTVAGLNKEDYTVTYRNAKKVGSATCVVTGTGNYTGKIECPYTIRLAAAELKTVANQKSGLSLTWDSVPGAEGYRIYRRTYKGKWQRIGDINSGDTLTYVDTSAKSGTWYAYRIRARKGTSFGAYSDAVVTRRLTRPAISVKERSYGVAVKWKSIKGAKKYKIYRQEEKGSMKQIGTTTDLYWKDKTARSGYRYVYTVKAVSGSAQSCAAKRVTIIKK
jgi:subtilisin family serine protease